MRDSQSVTFTRVFISLALLLPFALCKPLVGNEPNRILRLSGALLWDQKLVTLFEFAHDGKTLAACILGWLDDFSLPGALRLWNLDTQAKPVDLRIPGAKIVSIAIAHSGQPLFSGSYDGVVRTHDFRSSKTEVIPDLSGQIVKISSDGRRLAASAGQTVQMVEVSQMAHSQFARGLPEPCPAGREESADPSTFAQLFQPNRPPSGRASQPLENPGQIRQDHRLSLAEEPPETM
jgi:WD40 repeat protein